MARRSHLRVAQVSCQRECGSETGSAKQIREAQHCFAKPLFSPVSSLWKYLSPQAWLWLCQCSAKAEGHRNAPISSSTAHPDVPANSTLATLLVDCNSVKMLLPETHQLEVRQPPETQNPTSRSFMCAHLARGPKREEIASRNGRGFRGFVPLAGDARICSHVNKSSS